MTQFDQLSADNLKKVEEGYETLSKDPKNKSLLAKHLTKEIFDEIKKRATPKFGSTLLDAISSGIKNPDSGVGVYAPDALSYETFSPFMNQIIADYHGIGSASELKHPKTDFGNPSTLDNIDPENKYVISTRCRLARNIASIPFNPKMEKDHYIQLEKMVKEALKKFTGDLAGEYLSLAEMSDETKNKLIADHYLFKEGDRFLAAAQALNHWPTGRGIFLNKNKTFLIWVGEEDHLRLISMQKGAELGEVVARLENAVNEFSKNFDFAHSDQLGYLTFCPSNLGTTIRSSVHIKLPKLSADMKKFEELAEKYNLQIRGVHGEHSESKDGIYDVSNKRRFGYTERQVIDDMHKGCKALIAEEKKLEG